MTVALVGTVGLGSVSGIIQGFLGANVYNSGYLEANQVIPFGRQIGMAFFVNLGGAFLAGLIITFSILLSRSLTLGSKKAQISAGIIGGLIWGAIASLLAIIILWKDFHPWYIRWFYLFVGMIMGGAPAIAFCINLKTNKQRILFTHLGTVAGILIFMLIFYIARPEVSSAAGRYLYPPQWWKIVGDKAIYTNLYWDFLGDIIRIPAAVVGIALGLVYSSNHSR